MQQSFLLRRAGSEYGPYTVAELREYLNAGNIVLTDLAWDEVKSQWVPLPEVLARDFSVAPRPPRERSVVMLVGMAVVWWIVLALGFLVVASAFAGGVVALLQVRNPEAAGEAVGQIAFPPIIVGSLALSAWLTVLGKLPGTKK